MARSTAGKQAQALAAARERRNRLDAERRAREAQADELVAEFLMLTEARAQKQAEIDEEIARLQRDLAQVDADQAEVIGRLLDLGENETRVTALLEVPRKELRRLRQLIEAESVTSDGVGEPEPVS